MEQISSITAKRIAEAAFAAENATTLLRTGTVLYMGSKFISDGFSDSTRGAIGQLHIHSVHGEMNAILRASSRARKIANTLFSIYGAPAVNNLVGNDGLPIETNHRWQNRQRQYTVCAWTNRQREKPTNTQYISSY